MARVTRRRSGRRGLRVVAKSDFKGSLSAVDVSLWSCTVKSGGGGGGSHAVVLLLLQGRRRWVLNTVDSLSPTVHIPSNRDTGTAWQWQRRRRWQCNFALNRTKRRDEREGTYLFDTTHNTTQAGERQRLRNCLEAN
jgi:hypothetical protein